MMWWLGVGEGKMFYSFMIRCQSFDEPVLLGCELHTCFSVVVGFFFCPTPPLPLNWNKMPRGAGVAYFASPV